LYPNIDGLIGYNVSAGTDPIKVRRRELRALPKTLSLEAIRDEDPFLGSLLPYLASLQPGEIYLVGGYLRDYFLGDIPQDIDFITTADPGIVAHEVASRWNGKCFLLYEEEKTYRVVVDGDGKRRTLDFAPVKGMSVEEDLSYRDFTINAMAVDIERLIGEERLKLPRDLIDKHYGWRDLSRGILRECHNETFLMDPVRLVRAFRFRHVLDLEYEERTFNHLKKYASLITKVPGERVTIELMETLLISDSSGVFSELESTGLLQYIFPDLTDTVGLEQNAYHHLDVWSHTLLTLKELDHLLNQPEEVYPTHADEIRSRMGETLQDLQPRSSFLRLAALYHDVGKVETFARDGSGRIHFYSHQRHSEDAVIRLVQRLRLSNKAGDYLLNTVGKHMDILLNFSERSSSRMIRRLIDRMGDELVDVVLLSTADCFATRGPMTTEERLDLYVDFCRRLLDEYYRERDIPPLIKGGDLMELGMPQGQMIGEILAEVRIAQLEGIVGNRLEALNLARDIVSRRPRPEA
jgi:poly(A) polymerase